MSGTRALYVLSASLLLAGLAFLAVVTSGAFLPLSVIWLLAGMAVAVLLRALGEGRGNRVVITLFLVVACPVLVFEGGFFVLPSALTLLAADPRILPTEPSRYLSRGRSWFRGHSRTLAQRHSILPRDPRVRR